MLVAVFEMFLVDYEIFHELSTTLRVGIDYYFHNWTFDTHLGQLPREDKQRAGGEKRGVRAIINSSVSFRICEKRAGKNISDFSTSGLRK